MERKSKLLCVLVGAAVLCIVGILLAVCLINPHIFQPHFEATVLQVYEKTILVEVAKTADERRSSDLLSVSTVLTDEKRAAPALQEGDFVRVYYDGRIAESYPGQIHTVYAIERLETTEDTAPSQTA